MTKEYEQVREQAASKIYNDWCRYDDSDNLTWEELPNYRKATYREWVNEYIIPLVEIKADDQELPTDFPWQLIDMGLTTGMAEALFNFLKSKGFVRVVKEKA